MTSRSLTVSDLHLPQNAIEWIPSFAPIDLEPLSRNQPGDNLIAEHATQGGQVEDAQGCARWNITNHLSLQVIGEQKCQIATVHQASLD